MANAGGHREATRLFGAADAIRQHMGQLRLKVHDAVMTVRKAMGEKEFEDALAEGETLSGIAHLDRAGRRGSSSHRARCKPTSPSAVRLGTPRQPAALSVISEMAVRLCPPTVPNFEIHTSTLDVSV